MRHIFAVYSSYYIYTSKKFHFNFRHFAQDEVFSNEIFAKNGKCLLYFSKKKIAGWQSYKINMIIIQVIIVGKIHDVHLVQPLMQLSI